MTTRRKTVGFRRPYLPGLGAPGEDVLVFDFGPKPRTYEQRGVKVGRWFLPLGKWRQT